MSHNAYPLSSQSLFDRARAQACYARFTASLLALSASLLCFVSLAQAQLKQVSPPEGSAALNAEVSQALIKADHKSTLYLKVALTGLTPSAKKERPALNLALVIDRSGSMSGDRINRAKEAARLAVELLQPHDIVSVITYDDRAEVVVPATKASDKGSILKKIDSIGTRGSTALYAGVRLGADEALKFLERERVNRVVLLSDGIANVGPSSPQELAELGRQLGAQGIAVSTIGLGLGYNEDLMVQLATAAEGNHAFVEHADQLASVMGLELGDALAVVAKEVEVELTFPEGVRPVRALGRDATFKGQVVTASLGSLGAQQRRYVLIEAELAPTKVGVTLEVAQVKARYYDAVSEQRRSLESALQVSAVAEEAQAKASERGEVMEEVLSLLATEKQKLAVSLRDKGDREGAAQVLRSSAAMLKSGAKRYKSKKLDTLSAESAEESEKVKSSGADWSRTRKMMRQKSYKAASQQAY